MSDESETYPRQNPTRMYFRQDWLNYEMKHKPEINSFKFQLTSYTNLKELPKAFNILKIRQ